jgi:hypothetical protein
MKLVTKLLLVCSLGLASAVSSFAITWTQDTPLNVFLQANDNYNGSFDLTVYGYNPATSFISSATASFAFKDDSQNDDEEVVTISMNNTGLWSGDVDGSGNSSASWDWVSLSLSGTVLASLQDGKINYTVHLNNTDGINDTYLREAKLVATGSSRSVPDSGATLSMIGLGFIALVALRKRLC